MEQIRSKDFSLHTLASTVGSLAVLVPVLWFIGKPLIADALAEDIKGTVHQELRPLEASFKVLLDRDISALRKEIAQLKFRQRSGDDWTQDDAEYLAELEIELEALKEAREELVAESD
ncbi:hypothetical protein [[Eubacterium] cellulosolvens]